MSTLAGDPPYHHGNLRPALIGTALELLAEAGVEGLSLRAIARRAGVSAAAPYRHFADKTALLAAVAEHGFQQLARDLAAADQAPGTSKPLIAQGIAYVAFGRRHPALYRLMFSAEKAAASGDAALQAAGGAAFDILYNRVHRQIGPADARHLTLFCWSAMHGLSMLLLEGQIPEGRDADDARIRVLVMRVLRLLP